MGDWFENFDDSSSADGGVPAPSFDGETHNAPGDLMEDEVETCRSKPRLYVVLSTDELRASQQEALAQVEGILGCEQSTARALLMFFSWDAEATLEAVAEQGEDDILRRAGVLPRRQNPKVDFDNAGAVDLTVCSVCYGAFAASSTCCDTRTDQDQLCMTSTCGHTFCRSCWMQQLSMGITDGSSRRLKCMSPGCHVLCHEDRVRELLRDSPELLSKYNTALLDSYVEDNRAVKWCPSIPHCGRAVQVLGGDPYCEVECPCGQQFCFACCGPPHSPATCEMIDDWLGRRRDGSESLSWLTANTKACPKCSKPVEKNGGCNLVLCTCGQPFCWLCGQATGRAHDWYSISGHSCGAYKDEAESRANEGERHLKRYMHYLTRYEAHLDSLRFEERTRAILERKIETMMEASPTLSNHSWLMEALEQLFLARRVMAHSYVFAFYICSQSSGEEVVNPTAARMYQALFEDKQGQLETEVERLADMVEKTPADRMLSERLKVINLASGINLRIIKMYEVIENDIVPQLTGRSVGVAPYKGQRSKASWSGSLAVRPYGHMVVGTASREESIDLLGDSPNPVAKSSKRPRQQ